jgi:predicted RNase H-like nuclease (RuvC/YqgF family)
MGEKIKELENKIEVLTRKNNRLEDEIYDLKEEISDLEKENEKLECEIEDSETDSWVKTLDDDYKREFFMEYKDFFTPWEIERIFKNAKELLKK